MIYPRTRRPGHVKLLVRVSLSLNQKHRNAQLVTMAYQQLLMTVTVALLVLMGQAVIRAMMMAQLAGVHAAANSQVPARTGINMRTAMTVYFLVVSGKAGLGRL